MIQDTSSTPDGENTRSPLYPSNDEPPVYAVLVTNGETTAIDIDSARPILDQLRDQLPEATGLRLAPPFRDTEIWSCGRWDRARGMIMLALENGLVIGDDHPRAESMKVNRPAWACYGRTPVVGPVVILHDSTEAGLPVPIPPDILADILAPVPEEIHEAMAELIRTEGYARWSHRWDLEG